MKQLQRPLWMKGVLLTPQHLQVQDRFFEELVGFHLSAASFQPWGFSRLEIDREALQEGSLVVAQAAGLLADGVAFDSPGSDPLPPPRPLGEEEWSGDRERLGVYLGLPEYRPGGRNVSLETGDRGTRYFAEAVLRRDENTGQAEKPIQLARKNLRLLTDADPLDGHVLLPAVRLRRSDTGELGLDPDFVPPVLDIAASERLMTIARRIVEILSAKSAGLSAARRERGRGLADFGVSDVANFWLLYTVNTHLPQLRHLCETRHGHPSELFEALLSLAGALTTFSASVRPGSFPAYDHADLGRCFTGLDATVRELLETVVPAHHVALPLKEVESAIHATAVDHEEYLSTAQQMYLAVASSVKPDELLKKAPQLLKLSSADQVQRLIRQALPGVPLRHVPNPPSQIPVKLDYQYFQLDRSAEEWGAITRSRNLAVYVPSDFPDPRLELVIVLPQTR